MDQAANVTYNVCDQPLQPHTGEKTAAAGWPVRAVGWFVCMYYLAGDGAITHDSVGF